MKPLQHYTDQVNSPGKFEGEHPITPYLYAISCNGEGENICHQEDGCGLWATRFTLNGEEKEHFGLDDKTTNRISTMTGTSQKTFSDLILVEDSQGFVMAMIPEKFIEWIGKDLANELRVNL